VRAELSTTLPHLSIYFPPFLRGKGKAIPLQAWTGPECFRRLRLPEFLDNRHMKVAKLSALHTGRLYPPAETPGANFCYRLGRTQGDLSKCTFQKTGTAEQVESDEIRTCNLVVKLKRAYTIWEARKQRIIKYSQNIIVSKSNWIMYTRICKQFAIQDLDRLLGETQVLSPSNIHEQHIGLTKQVHLTTASNKTGSYNHS